MLQAGEGTSDYISQSVVLLLILAVQYIQFSFIFIEANSNKQLPQDTL